MPATLHRLKTEPKKLADAQAYALRQMILEYPGLPKQAASTIIAAIDGQTAAENGWTFVMLSPAQNSAVIAWLLDHSSRPRKSVRLWSLLFEHLRRDTGEIMLSREEMAGLIDTTATHVSLIMVELESIGAIIRRRERVPGMRGPGMVRYLMNPNVATHLKGKSRERAQATAPELRLVEPA
jgi:hypothetical protein